MAWFRKLFRQTVTAEQKAAAALEMAEMHKVVWPLYQANLKAHLGQIDLRRALEAKHDYRQVNDMFLWGIISSALAGRPALPTDAHSRIVLYMMSYFAQAEEKPFEEARLRAIAAKELFEKTDPFFDGVIEAGAVAYRDGGDHHLIRAHAAA